LRKSQQFKFYIRFQMELNRPNIRVQVSVEENKSVCWLLFFFFVLFLISFFLQT
jgi:hypothetical protein